MRQFFIIYFFLLAMVLTVFGLRGCTSTKPPLEIFPDMDRQAKFHEQGETPFFADGRMDRQPVAGADNRFREDDYLVTGRINAETFGDGIPIQISWENMNDGKDIYQVYCTMCHGDSGNGQGVIANPRYGYTTIASLLQTRIMELPDGDIYNTIANGKNTMGPYGSKIRIEDRWKVVMYVRALQRAANSTIEDVPADKRGELGL